MKTNPTTNKLKLVYSFNGKFRRQLPENKLRYVGGTTRIVSVDPTSLTFSKLHSLISERVNLDEFILRYRLPGTELGGCRDSPLVVVGSDDDVACMVEEFEDYCVKKNNYLYFRVWLYVCSENDDSEKIDDHFVGFSDEKGDFGCGFRVYGRNNNVGRRNNNNNKKGGSSEKDCLRKLVLKQQLMLARQSDQIQGYLGSTRSLGTNYKVSNYDHDSKPLIDLGDDVCGLISTNKAGSDQDSGSLPLYSRDFESSEVSCAEEFITDDCLISMKDHQPGFCSKKALQGLNEENKIDLLSFEESCGDQVAKIVSPDISESVPEITKQTVMVPTSANSTAVSMDLSLYDPPISSSKLTTPESSCMSPKICKSLEMVEEIRPKLDQSCKLQHETQEDPLTSTDVDEKVVIRTSLKYSNMPDGIPSDLVAFYTHFATRELQIIKESDLEYVKELGSGNYGTVYHGKWKGCDVAVKKIKPRCFNRDTKEDDRLVADFWKEAHMLSQLQHPNIVAFYGVVTDGPISNFRTVTEYMINGSLKQVLQRKDRTIDRRKRLIIAMDAAFGMEYLHEKNIVHFDLKSHNFLVNIRDPRRPVCKIGDLGLSKVKQRTMVSGGVRGTIPWMAPQLLNTSTDLVSEKVDVYSFGIVMWELLTGEEPYADMRSGEIIAGIIKGTLRPEIPTWCDPAWRSLMERCWSSDPNSRPPFSEIAKELRAMSASMNIK